MTSQSEEWLLACFSFALLASALMSLVAGRLMDRYGAGNTMKVASFVGAASCGFRRSRPGVPI